MVTATTPARISKVARQSWWVISQATSGDMVTGAMPMPAETSDTARLRWVSNQPVTQAIIGANTAAALAPTRTPKINWNAGRLVARLARARLDASTMAPISTTTRGPKRSESPPQTKPATAMARKAMVMAADTPVTDQWVDCAIGRNRTGSENMAPIAMQPSRPPAATITHRYRDLSIIRSPHGATGASEPRTKRNAVSRQHLGLFVQAHKAKAPRLATRGFADPKGIEALTRSSRPERIPARPGSRGRRSRR